MQIRSKVFLRKLANKQTDKQTNKQRRLHILLGGGNNNSIRYGILKSGPDRTSNT